MDLICGSTLMDFSELQKIATYDGFVESSVFIQNFWSILHDLSDEEKKKFLFFTTGSDRIPVGGLSRLRLVIAKNGGDRFL